MSSTIRSSTKEATVASSKISTRRRGAGASDIDHAPGHFACDVVRSGPGLDGAGAHPTLVGWFLQQIPQRWAESREHPALRRVVRDAQSRSGRIPEAKRNE